MDDLIARPRRGVESRGQSARETRSPEKHSAFSRFMHRFATPLTTGLFVVSAVSGIALFFHWAPTAFHTMHVWLSMVLLLPFILHVELPRFRGVLMTG